MQKKNTILKQSQSDNTEPKTGNGIGNDIAKALIRKYLLAHYITVSGWTDKDAIFAADRFVSHMTHHGELNAIINAMSDRIITLKDALESILACSASPTVHKIAREAIAQFPEGGKEGRESV